MNSPLVTPDLPPDLGLTKAHYSRLRFYWVNRGNAPVQGQALDLDLHRFGLIELSHNGYGAPLYRATKAGVDVLAIQTERERVRRLPHHALGGRLAQWLRTKRRMTWEGVEFRVQERDVYDRAAALGIDVTDARGVLFAFPRPDVFSIFPTLQVDKLKPVVHEIKVSRADFLADVAKPLKRLAYACVAEAVYYVAPVGLIEPDEVPAHCGLLVERAPGEFKKLKKAPEFPVQLLPVHYMNLVIKPGLSAVTEDATSA